MLRKNALGNTAKSFAAFRAEHSSKEETRRAAVDSLPFRFFQLCLIECCRAITSMRGRRAGAATWVSQAQTEDVSGTSREEGGKSAKGQPEGLGLGSSGFQEARSDSSESEEALERAIFQT
eukprot:179778-Rhodomonas_salina.1